MSIVFYMSSVTWMFTGFMHLINGSDTNTVMMRIGFSLVFLGIGKILEHLEKGKE